MSDETVLVRGSHNNLRKKRFVATESHVTHVDKDTVNQCSAKGRIYVCEESNFQMKAKLWCTWGMANVVQANFHALQPLVWDSGWFNGGVEAPTERRE